MSATEHEITLDEGPDTLEVLAADGSVHELTKGTPYMTIDAADAAAIADHAQRQGGQVTVVTTYPDGEPAATSVYTGSDPAAAAEEDEEPPASRKRPEKAEPKGGASA